MSFALRLCRGQNFKVCTNLEYGGSAALLLRRGQNEALSIGTVTKVSATLLLSRGRNTNLGKLVNLSGFSCPAFEQGSELVAP